MIGTVATVPTYRRPMVSRHEPDILERAFVKIDCVDSDRLARAVVEAQSWTAWRVEYADRHGYPTA